MYCPHNGKLHQHSAKVYVPPTCESCEIVSPNVEFDECECSLGYHLVEDMFDRKDGENIFVCDRMDGDRRRTSDEMVKNIMLQIDSRWLMKDYSAVPQRIRTEAAEAVLRMEEDIGANQEKIPEMMNARAIPSERHPPVNVEVAKAYKLYDLEVLSAVDPTIDAEYCKAHVWKQCINTRGEVVIRGLAWDITTDDEMLSEMRSWSCYNRAFTGDEFGRYVHYTLTNMYPDKIVRLYKKLNTKSHALNKDFETIQHLVPHALKILYDMIGTRDKFGTLDFKYTKEDIEEHMPNLNTANGLIPGPNTPFKSADGITNIISPRGQKCENYPTSVKMVQEAIKKVEAGEDPPHPAPFVQKTIKPEFVSVDAYSIMKDMKYRGHTMEEIREAIRAAHIKAYYKARAYFISTTPAYILSSMMDNHRQLMERGKIIKIGMRWSRGGAFELAKQLHWLEGYDERIYDPSTYNNHQLPKRFWGSMDVSGFDTIVKEAFLRLYSNTARLYFNFSDMDWLTKMVFDWASRRVGEELAARITHVFHRLWVIFRGKMPSGFKETSHGDSWISAFMYCLFLAHSMVINPTYASTITSHIDADSLFAIVYGDDFINTGPYELEAICGIRAYVDFLKKYLDVDCREVESYNDLISKPSFDGELDRPGPVFLKRYFVKAVDCGVSDPSAVAPVLPFRPFSQTMLKLAWGTNRVTSEEYLLACIGLACDTFGSNYRSYEFCKRVFHILIAHNKLDFKEIIRKVESMSELPPSITRLMIKAEFDLDAIKNGFPSYEELWNRNIYDANYVDFKKYEYVLLGKGL